MKVFAILFLLFISSQKFVYANNVYLEKAASIQSEIESAVHEVQELKKDVDIVYEILDRRSKWVKFVMGTNYSQVNLLKEIASENKDKIKLLSDIEDTIEDSEELKKTRETLDELRTINGQIEDRIRIEQNRFSVFGWIYNLINKEKLRFNY